MNDCKNCNFKNEPPHKYRCRTCLKRTKFERHINANPSAKCEHCKHVVECFKPDGGEKLRDECMVFTKWEAEVLPEVESNEEVKQEVVSQ